MMADSTHQPLSSFDLSKVDTDHLARQALQLFRQRYGVLYQSHCGVVDTDNKGYVTHDELVDFMLKQWPKEGREIVEKTWIALCGGQTDVSQLSRDKLIDLCIKGFHSKDRKHVQFLEDTVTAINRHHFDWMDLNHDGIISKAEFLSWAEDRGFTDNWPDAFAAMDLNGNGEIDRDEFLQCNLGFFLHIEEERYNHFFGIVKK